MEQLELKNLNRVTNSKPVKEFESKELQQLLEKHKYVFIAEN